MRDLRPNTHCLQCSMSHGFLLLPSTYTRQSTYFCAYSREGEPTRLSLSSLSLSGERECESTYQLQPPLLPLTLPHEALRIYATSSHAELTLHFLQGRCSRLTGKIWPSNTIRKPTDESSDNFDTEVLGPQTRQNEPNENRPLMFLQKGLV